MPLELHVFLWSRVADFHVLRVCVWIVRGLSLRVTVFKGVLFRPRQVFLMRSAFTSGIIETITTRLYCTRKKVEIVIMQGEFSTDDQAITMLRGKFFDALQKYAPAVWNEFSSLQNLYSEFASGIDSRDRWITWVQYAYILEPPEIRPHWSTFSHVRDNPFEMKHYQDQFNLFAALDHLKKKYAIQDIWIIDSMLSLLDHKERYPASRDIPSEIVTMKMFLAPIDPQRPRIHAYESQWISRKNYLAQAMAILEKYCDEIESQSEAAEMKRTRRPHVRALEWLVEYHFNSKSYAHIAMLRDDDADESAVRKAIRKVAKDLHFTCRASPSKGRPKKST